MNNILITGVSGFIGLNLTKKLLEEGYHIVGCSRSEPSDKGILRNPAFEFERCDLTSDSEVNNLFEKHKIDTVIHLAAYISYDDHNPNNVKKIFSTNVSGTLNILSAMVKFNLKRMVFTSTMSVIGETEYLPVDEAHRCNPLNFYGLTKKFCEELTDFFSQNYLLDICVLRFSGIFSEERKSGAIFNFIKKAFNDEDIILDLKFPTPWDIIYLDDAIDTIVGALSHNISGFQIYNVGYGVPVNIEIIADKIIKLTTSKSRIVKRGNAEPPTFYFNTEKFSKIFGSIHPSLEERLKKVICELKRMEGKNDQSPII